VPGFDITSILDFQPPKFICMACRGLLDDLTGSRDEAGRLRFNICPVCDIRYEPGEFAPKGPGAAYQFLRDRGYTVANGRDLFQHATELATLLQQARRQHWPTMRLLFECLSRARDFVHFASWGISHQLIGALKMTSMRVPVYGFVSNVENSARVELTEFPSETPKFTAHVIPTSNGVYDAPHQKVIVIDGLLAFTGSTNLTNTGLRKSDRGLDISEVKSEFEEVGRLNNSYFAPVWKRLTMQDQDALLYFDDAPF